MLKLILKEENLINRIYSIRGEKVMLDFDLAFLYGISTKALKQAVKRNKKRFPSDFMFELNNDQFNSLRSQFVPSKGKGGNRYMPYAFTEQGIAMLSSVLNSEKAFEVNIAIMRTFVQVRNLMSIDKDFTEQIEKLEKKYDGKFRIISKSIKKLIEENEEQKTPIRFSLN